MANTPQARQGGSVAFVNVALLKISITFAI
jgi:hypothetical protein